jgi:cytochrome P450
MVDWMASLHREHGPIVRVGPSELSFVNAQAWQDIYGFQPSSRAANRKDPKFYDFASMENMRHMINANDQDHSRMRHAFSHAFSNKALKEQEPLLVKFVDLLGQVLQEKVDQGEADARLDVKVDMVQMLNFTTFDIMGMALSCLACNSPARRSYLWRAPLHAPKLRVHTMG